MTIFDALAKTDLDFQHLARGDVGDAGREQVGALLLDQAGHPPLGPCGFIGDARLPALLDLTFDHSTANDHPQTFHGDIVGQREDIAALGPVRAVVEKLLADDRIGQHAGHLDVDVGDHGQRRDAVLSRVQPELRTLGVVLLGECGTLNSQQQGDEAKAKKHHSGISSGLRIDGDSSTHPAGDRGAGMWRFTDQMWQKSGSCGIHSRDSEKRIKNALLGAKSDVRSQSISFFPCELRAPVVNQSMAANSEPKIPGTSR